MSKQKKILTRAAAFDDQHVGDIVERETGSFDVFDINHKHLCTFANLILASRAIPKVSDAQRRRREEMKLRLRRQST